VLFAGGTDWQMLGRSIGKNSKKDPKAEAEREEKYPNLLSPTRLKALEGVKVMFVAAGPAAVHCLVGDASGNLYTWGRNEKGQLGHGDSVNRNRPTVVEELKGKFVVGAAGGRHHSLAYTREGEAWAWGLNQQGQLGIGSIKKAATKGFEHIENKPVKAMVERCVGAAAGIDFSLWIAGGGKLYSAGSPQFGQTGDGSDHAYNAKDSSIAIVYEPQPTPKLVPALAAQTVTRVAAGHQHAIAVDDAGSAYTWGNGGYGRLGHRVQKDEFAPRKLEDLSKGRTAVPKDAVVAAGSTSSFVTTLIGGAVQQLYTWGKLKTNGDSQMYPMPDSNMTGWTVRSVACGPNHFAIAADQSAITWGAAINGELGYGPNGKKSSANPAKVDALEGVATHQVACGMGFTLFLCDANAPAVKKCEVWDSSVDEDGAGAASEDSGDAGGAKGGKRKAGAAGGAAKKGKK